MTLSSGTIWQMLEQSGSGEPLPRGLDAAWDAGVGMLLLTSILVAVRRDDVAEAVRRGFLILATVVSALWLFAAFFSTGLSIP